MLPGVFQPGGQMVKRFPARNVVNQEGAGGPAVIRARDRAERLLAGRVPYLKLDLFAVDRDHPRAKLHADGQVMDGLKSLVGELKQQTRLSHPYKQRNAQVPMQQASKVHKRFLDKFTNIIIVCHQGFAFGKS